MIQDLIPTAGVTPTATANARVLVLFVHPALEKSRVHRELSRAIADAPGITLHDLCEAYPHFDVDVKREQALLLAHDVIVFQHPFYWYSTPALLKQWEDLVLEHGWAYGRNGTALRGSPEKTLGLVHTAKKHFPNLTVLARASDRDDAIALMEAGVTHIYRETLDTSLRVGVDALRMLGFRAYYAGRAARTFLRHDEEALHELAAVRGDRAAFLVTARRRIEDLEHLLRTDLEHHDQERDAAWDAETLRQEFGQGP